MVVCVIQLACTTHASSHLHRNLSHTLTHCKAQYTYIYSCVTGTRLRGVHHRVRPTLRVHWCTCNRNRPNDVTEGAPCVLGVKHAASGPTPACHTAGAGPGPRTDCEAESANALFQHNTCAQRDKS